MTLLCGYLGAGKSTLVKSVDYVPETGNSVSACSCLSLSFVYSHILSSADHGLRIAVVLNEFADTTDFESNALRLSATDAGNDVPEILELPNGCLCCSVRDTGAAAIQELLKRKDYDYVLLGALSLSCCDCVLIWQISIETTGLADPSVFLGCRTVFLTTDLISLSRSRRDILAKRRYERSAGSGWHSMCGGCQKCARGTAHLGRARH